MRILYYKCVDLVFSSTGVASMSSDKEIESRKIIRFAPFTPSVGQTKTGKQFISQDELKSCSLTLMMGNFEYVKNVNASFFMQNEYRELFKPNRALTGLSLKDCFLEGNVSLSGKAVQFIFELER